MTPRYRMILGITINMLEGSKTEEVLRIIESNEPEEAKITKLESLVRICRQPFKDIRFMIARFIHIHIPYNEKHLELLQEWQKRDIPDESIEEMLCELLDIK